MRNDEALMTNDEGMTKHGIRKDFAVTIRHLFICHSLELRHSSFVIFTP